MGQFSVKIYGATGSVLSDNQQCGGSYVGKAVRRIVFKPTLPQNLALAVTGDVKGQVNDFGHGPRADGSSIANSSRSNCSCLFFFIRRAPKITMDRRFTGPVNAIRFLRLERRRDTNDRVRRHFQPIMFCKVAATDAQAHAAGIHRDDLLIQPGDPGLTLANQLRLETFLAVVRHLDLKGAVLGLERLCLGNPFRRFDFASTLAGTIGLNIPKLRNGCYLRSFL